MKCCKAPVLVNGVHFLYFISSKQEINKRFLSALFLKAFIVEEKIIMWDPKSYQYSLIGDFLRADDAMPNTSPSSTPNSVASSKSSASLSLTI